MRILYIHGLDSEPSPEKLALMRERGHLVGALHLDYRKDRSAYWRLREEALQLEAEYIVGSSMGGYFGYWLGQDLGLPQLLFNPAMPFRSVHVPKPEVDERAEIKTWVVLGQHDEVIPPNLNREFFSHRPHARLLTCAWLGHRIDLDTFREMLCWAGL